MAGELACLLVHPTQYGSAEGPHGPEGTKIGSAGTLDKCDMGARTDTVVSAIPDRSLACNSRVSAQEGAYPPSRLRAFALPKIN